MTTKSERIVARLPVIRTCNDCSHCQKDGATTCMHAATQGSVLRGREYPPPSWCPLRGDATTALPAEAGPECGGQHGDEDCIYCGSDASDAPAEAGELEGAVPDDAWHAFRRAVMNADEKFQASGDSGTKHWIREYLEPEMASEGLCVVRRPAPPVSAPDDSVLMRAVKRANASGYVEARHHLSAEEVAEGKLGYEVDRIEALVTDEEALRIISSVKSEASSATEKR